MNTTENHFAPQLLKNIVNLACNSYRVTLKPFMSLLPFHFVNIFIREVNTILIGYNLDYLWPIEFCSRTCKWGEMLANSLKLHIMEFQGKAFHAHNG